MGDFQGHRTQQVRNTPEALIAHRVRFLRLGWRRIGMKPIDGDSTRVRVTYERIYDSHTIKEEEARIDNEARGYTPPVPFAALSPHEQCRCLDTLIAALQAKQAREQQYVRDRARHQQRLGEGKMSTDVDYEGDPFLENALLEILAYLRTSLKRTLGLDAEEG
jgi:hypothetical protein